VGSDVEGPGTDPETEPDPSPPLADGEEGRPLSAGAGAVVDVAAAAVVDGIPEDEDDGEEDSLDAASVRRRVPWTWFAAGADATVDNVVPNSLSRLLLLAGFVTGRDSSGPTLPRRVLSTGLTTWLRAWP
jgi:hypothetical protein